MKYKIKETIIVEGKYDKNTLSQVIDANIVTLSGFSVFKDKEKSELIKQLALKNGIIVFTDSDGAGFVLRNYIKGTVPAELIKNAYTPEIFGKERRKSHPSKEGKLGVEGMSPETILTSLRRCGATFEGESVQTEKHSILSKTDFYKLGLSGGEGSAEKRRTVLKALGFPAAMSCNAMLEAVNVLYTADEFYSIVLSMQN